MNIGGIFAVICLLVPVVAKSQSTAPSTKTSCGMSETKLKSLLATADTMDTNDRPSDDQINDIYKSWEQDRTEALKCQLSAQTPRDGEYAAEQLVALWGFRAKYDEIREAETEKALHVQITTLEAQVSNLQKIVGQPYINEPRPIHMVCRGAAGCDGEVLIPNARARFTPFHMSCRVVGSEVQCDGDLMP
jgi:hypothetical protein